MTLARRSLQDLQNNFEQIVGQVQQSGMPVVLTAHGEPALVLMSASDYEEQTHAFRVAQLLATGERDVADGRVRPASEFFAELHRGDEVSG